MGVDREIFFISCPKDLEPYVKAHQIKMDMQDALNWQLGQYISIAIGSSLSKDVHYPKKPLFQFGETDDEDSNNEEIAVIEMKRRAKILAEQGLQESPS